MSGFAQPFRVSYRRKKRRCERATDMPAPPKVGSYHAAMLCHFSAFQLPSGRRNRLIRTAIVCGLRERNQVSDYRCTRVAHLGPPVTGAVPQTASNAFQVYKFAPLPTCKSPTRSQLMTDESETHYSLLFRIRPILFFVPCRR